MTVFSDQLTEIKNSFNKNKMKRDFKHITLVDMKAKPALVRLNRPSFYSYYKLVPPFRE
ncbi:hypothetical protein KK2020170_22170 [Flavobacterium okayamense]|uniref:Uncharacterized protein n=1 Tax=Flavobacterium okayamense TaxID=2830782 RepID=A0ABM7S7H9_9FLAO|nr:hypothetical protein KK2020170_22170 [Flavobacterium okayamense]